MKTNCHCGSSLSYKVCCGPYHFGNLFPPTAEALMRSRYSAYVMDKPQYLYQTWHKETRPTLKSIRNSTPYNYLSLKIINTDLGRKQDDIGTVTFVASYNDGLSFQEYKEVSLFKRIGERWTYFKGDEVLKQMTG